MLAARRLLSQDQGQWSRMGFVGFDEERPHQARLLDGVSGRGRGRSILGQRACVSGLLDDEFGAGTAAMPFGCVI